MRGPRSLGLRATCQQVSVHVQLGTRTHLLAVCSHWGTRRLRAWRLLRRRRSSSSSRRRRQGLLQRLLHDLRLQAASRLLWAFGRWQLPLLAGPPLLQLCHLGLLLALAWRWALLGLLPLLALAFQPALQLHSALLGGLLTSAQAFNGDRERDPLTLGAQQPVLEDRRGDLHAVQRCWVGVQVHGDRLWGPELAQQALQQPVPRQLPALQQLGRESRVPRQDQLGKLRQQLPPDGLLPRRLLRRWLPCGWRRALRWR